MEAHEVCVVVDQVEPLLLRHPDRVSSLIELDQTQPLR